MLSTVSLLVASDASAQGTCGAAGGPPAGPAASVCDYAHEATGVPRPGPAAGAGNPVDLVTGNKYRHELDLHLPGPLPLVLARHYNSHHRHAGPLGAGWSHTFETRLIPVRRGGVLELQLIQGDGRRIVFAPDRQRPGRWRTAHVTDGVVGRAPSGGRGWRWRMPGGRTVSFDGAGRLRTISRDGTDHLWVHHDIGGRVVLVEGSWDARLAFEYAVHPAGSRLARLTRDGHALAVYTYDEAGQLAAVRRPDGREQRYRYDDPLDPLRLTEVLEVASGSGADPVVTARYRYDAQGRVVHTEAPGGETLTLTWNAPARHALAGGTEVTDATGRRARYRWRYDRRRHEVRWLDARGDPCDSCPPAPRRYRQDRAGRTVRIEAPQGWQSVSHDALGRAVEASRGPAGSSASQWSWRVAYPDDDPVAGPSRIEQPSVAPGRIHRIDIARDPLGRVVAVAERGYTPERAPGGGVRFRAIERHFALGHRDPAQGAPNERDPASWLSGLAWVDGPAPGPADRIHLRQHGTPREGSLVLTHPLGREERVRYRNGVAHEHQSVAGPTVQLGAAGEGPWLAAGPRVGGFTGAASIEPQHTPAGDLQAVVRTDWQRGRIDRVTTRDPPAGPALRATAWWRGAPVSIALADGAQWTRGFDDFGRVVWIQPPGQPREWAGYDEHDRLVSHRLADGTVLQHRRDVAGRLLETTRIGIGGVTTPIGRYRWAGEQLVEAASEAVTIRYGWDALGRLESVAHAFAHRPDAVLRYRWHRDLAGRVVAETLPDGLVVHYTYHGRTVAGLHVAGLAPHPPVSADAQREPLSLGDSPAPPPGDPAARFEGGRLLHAGGIDHLPDPHGRRAAKRAADAGGAARHTDFVHHDWRLRTERDPDGHLRHWLWADAQPVAVIDRGRLLRLVTDQRRAPVRALHADGRIAWSARYDRAGAARVDPGAELTLALRLPGQYLDAETGWHHNHWRTYDPATGRYLEPDPLGLQPSYTGRDSLFAYADGDPVGGTDPWGLARITWFALTGGADGRPLGRTQGFDRARWSFIVEDILPVPLEGLGRTPPRTAGIDGLLFDPWGDFVRAQPAGSGNGLDTIAWSGATGRQVFAAFAAHYGNSLARIDRFVIDGFDDRRAGALALILAANPTERAACVARVLGSLPGIDLGPVERRILPAGPASGGSGPPRLLDCRGPDTLPVRYRDETERSRTERLQAAAELQESPSAAIGSSCEANQGCRTRARIDVNGRSYWASYGRTQFTVTTFLAELLRLTATDGGADASALRAAVGLERPATIEGRAGTVTDALTLARRRVDASYRAFSALRTEFGRAVPAARAAALWEALPAARRAEFTADTGLGRDAFVDMLGYEATGIGGRTEEEGRHALAASALATVRFVPSGSAGPVGFDTWLTALFASGDPYDHLSRAFLRDNLRRVLAAPRLAGRFDNLAPPDTDAWRERQQSIELDLARRVAVLHNAGRVDLATRPDLEDWLRTNGTSWIATYVQQFTTADARGNWEALRCADGLGGSGGLQFTALTAMPGGGARRPGPTAPGR